MLGRLIFVPFKPNASIILLFPILLVRLWFFSVSYLGVFRNRMGFLFHILSIVFQLLWARFRSYCSVIGFWCRIEGRSSPSWWGGYNKVVCQCRVHILGKVALESPFSVVECFGFWLKNLLAKMKFYSFLLMDLLSLRVVEPSRKAYTAVIVSVSPWNECLANLFWI